MTSSSRRALPWLLSVGVHLSAVLVMALWLVMPSSPIVVPVLDVSLLVPQGAGGSPPAGAPAQSRPSSPALPASSPRANSTAASPQAAPATVVRPSPESPAEPASTTTLPTGVTAPAASDVLSDVAAVAAGPGGVRSSSPADVTGLGGPSFGWTGEPRRLIRKRDPEFPAVLSASGQEIEGEARITVAPSGTVTRVEITRSSGYIEIDASIEAALRDYLFSRVDSRVDTVGTVQFRFRLEKQD